MKTIQISGSAKILASASGSPRRFAMDAYNGGPMRFAWSRVPVVVDLAGMQVTDKPRPILRDHELGRVVGHTTSIQIGSQSLYVEGVASGTGPDAQEVIATADNGFPWQASIGADILETEDFGPGASVQVNGRAIDGPVLVVRASRLGEISFVAIGADDSTVARMIAARNSQPPVHKENPMDFAAWIKSLGLDPATLTPEQTAALQKEYDAKMAAAKAAPAPAAQAGAIAPDLAASRKSAADELRRIEAIRTAASGHPAIAAKAIEEGWSKDQTELAVLKASRPTGPAIHMRNDGVTADVLTCAVLQASRPTSAGGEDDNQDRASRRHEKRLNEFPEQVQAAADRMFRGRISLGRLILEAACANGYAGRESLRDNPREVLRAAFGLQAAGFSTIDISSLLSNIANKFLLDGFMAVEQAWRKISSVRPVNDFKTITSYRLDGDQKYKKVGATGEIEHGTLTEVTYTNKADTYAKMLSITRRDIINDDLGAINQVPQRLGRGAGLALNEVFWTAFLDDSAFFTSGNGNFFVGATSSLLTIDGLTEAERLFLVQTDPSGNPVGVDPRILLVPPALKAKQYALINSTEIRDTTASTKAPTGNPFVGRFDPVWSRYLSSSAITGNSATAWYLLADPADLAVIETCFLNGQEAPTVESADADFNSLGIQLRGYHDFGVAKQEYRAGVKSKGAA